MADSKETHLGLGRGARWLLYGSLLLNVMIVGLLIGAVATLPDRRENRLPPRADEVGLGPILTALEPRDRRRLGASMRQVLRDEGLTRREMRERMSLLITTLQAEPFERDAIDAILDQQMTEAEFRLVLARQLFVDWLSELSPGERAAYASRLEAVLEAQRRGPEQGRNSN